MTQIKTQVLDHGYVKFIESWGSDEAIIEAARMSTDKGFCGWGEWIHSGECPFLRRHRDLGLPGSEKTGPREPTGCCKGQPGDEKLLSHLWTKKHSTPFEFAGLTIEVQAPLMVFREWHRHRTQSFSERSARYTPLADMNYIPTIDRLMLGVATAGSNKQAGALKGSDDLTLESGLEWLAELADVYEDCERVYQSGLRRGVPKELARLPVPVGRYSTMRASTDLRNWLGFCALRMPSDAQWEIRQYANVVHQILTENFPRTLELFDKGMAQ